nr:MAG TPA: hypothetical protein [Caudoviricetes sp.]DAY37281.1 MAG TPA: hypothetical protein [Bacteriophage sp.]
MRGEFLHDCIVQVDASMMRVHVYMSIITTLLFECNG